MPSFCTSGIPLAPSFPLIPPQSGTFIKAHASIWYPAKESKLKVASTSSDQERSNQRRFTSQVVLRFVGFFRGPDAPSLILGVVIALSVCIPFLGGARILLLDWSNGPHDPLVSSLTLGLNGGLTTGIGGSIVTSGLNDLIGGASTWLPIFLFFPISMVGAGRLAGRNVWSRLAAGTIYAVNPFVFNRIYVGHLPLLIGYALLPYAVATALRSIPKPVERWPLTTIWWALLTALSPHFAWIYGVVVVAVGVLALVERSVPVRRVLSWFVAVVFMFALMSAYILLPQTDANLPTQVGGVSLALYRTIGDPHWGLLLNVAALYGFWRTGPGPQLPKDVIRGWPFIMLAVLLLAIYGAWSTLRTFHTRTRHVSDGSQGDADRDASVSSGTLVPRFQHRTHGWVPQRRLAYVLAFIGVSGYFLTLGDQGPTGPLFLWAYDHVPFFAVMREPQKFLMLFALALAVFFGWGVEKFVKDFASKRRSVTVGLALALGIILPLAYTPTIFDGLAGQLTSSTIPSAYQQADDLMGTGPGNILYVPWHLYLSYPFTSERVVNNIAPSYFRRNVISGDNVQAGDVQTQSTSLRSSYLQSLFTDGPKLEHFGELVAPLGVKYVVLAKTVDWLSYEWIASQSDLRLVFNSPSLEVWRNMAYVGVGQRANMLTKVASLSEVLRLARSNQLVFDVAVLDRGLARNQVSKPSGPTRSVSTLGRANGQSVRELSPVAYAIAPGAPGWVNVDAPYQRGWSMDGHPAIASAEGTVLVHVGEKGGVVTFGPWGRLRFGYIISLGSLLLAVLAGGIGGRLRMRRRKRQKIEDQLFPKCQNVLGI